MNLQYTYYTTRSLTKYLGISRQAVHQRLDTIGHIKTKDEHILVPEYALKEPNETHVSIHGEEAIKRTSDELDYLKRTFTLPTIAKRMNKTKKQLTDLLQRGNVTPIQIDNLTLIHEDDLKKLPQPRAKGEKEPVEVSLWYWHGRISKNGYELLEQQRAELLKQYDLTTVEANSAIVAAGLDLLATGVDPELIETWRTNYKDVEPNGQRNQSPRIGLTPEQTQRFEELRKRYSISQARMVDLAIYAYAHLTQDT